MNRKKLSGIVVIIVSVLFAFSCNGNVKKAEKGVLKGDASVVEVSIGGMSCVGCEQTIQNNVGKLEGVKSVKASFTTGNAIVEYFPSIVDTLKIKEAIAGSGYVFKKFSTVQPEGNAR